MDKLVEELSQCGIESGFVVDNQLYAQQKDRMLSQWQQCMESKSINLDSTQLDVLDKLQCVFRFVEAKSIEANDVAQSMRVLFDFCPTILKYCAFLLSELAEIDTNTNKNVNSSMYQQLLQKCLTIYNTVTKQLLVTSETDIFANFVNNDNPTKGYIFSLIDLSSQIKLYDICIVKNFWLSTKKIIPKLTRKSLISIYVVGLLQSINYQLQPVKSSISDSEAGISQSENSVDSFSEEFVDHLIVVYKVVAYFFKFHSNSTLGSSYKNLISATKNTNINNNKGIGFEKSIESLLLDVITHNMFLLIRLERKKSGQKENFNSIANTPLLKFALDVDTNFIVKLIGTFNIAQSSHSLLKQHTFLVVDILLKLVKSFQQLLYKQLVSCEFFESLIGFIGQGEVIVDGSLVFTSKVQAKISDLLIIFLDCCHVDNLSTIFSFFYHYFFDNSPIFSRANGADCKENDVINSFSVSLTQQTLNDVIVKIICQLFDGRTALDHLSVLFYVYTQVVATPTQSHNCFKLELLLCKVFWKSTKLLQAFCQRIHRSKSKLFVFQLLRHLFNEKPSYFTDIGVVESLFCLIDTSQTLSTILSIEKPYIEGFLCFVQMLIDNNQPLKFDNVPYKHLFIDSVNKLVTASNSQRSSIETYSFWNILQLCIYGLNRCKQLSDRNVVDCFRKLFDEFATSTTDFNNLCGVVTCAMVVCNDEQVAVPNTLVTDDQLNALSTSIGFLVKNFDSLDVALLCVRILKALSFCGSFNYSKKILEGHCPSLHHLLIGVINRTFSAANDRTVTSFESNYQEKVMDLIVECVEQQSARELTAKLSFKEFNKIPATTTIDTTTNCDQDNFFNVTNNVMCKLEKLQNNPDAVESIKLVKIRNILEALDQALDY